MFQKIFIIIVFSFVNFINKLLEIIAKGIWFVINKLTNLSDL